MIDVPTAPKRHLTKFNYPISLILFSNGGDSQMPRLHRLYLESNLGRTELLFISHYMPMGVSDLPVLFVPVPKPTKNPITSTAASGARACKVHPRDVAPIKKHLLVSSILHRSRQAYRANGYRHLNLVRSNRNSSPTFL